MLCGDFAVSLLRNPRSRLLLGERQVNSVGNGRKGLDERAPQHLLLTSKHSISVYVASEHDGFL